jgi:hypothetical protein
VSQPLGPMRPDHRYGYRSDVSARTFTCPACGHKSDALTDPDQRNTPNDGDYAVCFYCGEVAVIVNGPFGMAVREPTIAELEQFRAQGHAEMVRAVHRFHGRSS